MSDGRPSDKYITNVDNNNVSSYGHSVYHYVCEVCNKHAIADIPKTTLFENPETPENRGKETRTEKED